jgi:hypothetical protein
VPVFISKQPMARLGAVSELTTPWRRWFAWYPVQDFGVTYWLCWIEWRRVVPDMLASDAPPFPIAQRVKYRLPETAP